MGTIWSVSADGDTYGVEPTGKEAYVGEVRYNGELVYKSAISTDLGFPTYVAAYDSDMGDLELEVEPQEYSS